MVRVVTCPELGWDCIVAVFDEIVAECHIEAMFPYPAYVITEMHLEFEVEE